MDLSGSGYGGGMGRYRHHDQLPGRTKCKEFID